MSMVFTVYLRERPDELPDLDEPDELDEPLLLTERPLEPTDELLLFLPLLR